MVSMSPRGQWIKWHPRHFIHSANTTPLVMSTLKTQSNVLLQIYIPNNAGNNDCKVTWYSLQNKIWNLPARSTILPKFICDKEGKVAGLIQILPVKVRGPALILKAVDSMHTYSVGFTKNDFVDYDVKTQGHTCIVLMQSGDLTIS